MATFKLHPGEGLPFWVEYGFDTSTWTVTAEILVDGVVMEVPPPPVTRRIDSGTWEVLVTLSHTRALAGRRAILRVTGVDPAAPTTPDVEEAELIVTPF
jgi:hypothetical protein